MARCYSGWMVKRHALPHVWMITDVRNDARIEHALRRLPRGSGLVFRHYHLDHAARRARFDRLARIARAHGHLIALAGSAREALRWGADAAYGAPATVGSGPALLRLVTAHSLREIAQARRARADAILLSPVFATRSHPGAPMLGPVRFRLLARHTQIPVIALGGMDRRRALGLKCTNWAAIDGI
jgi:thiamine-phosphate pyrophosphorylase